MANTKSRADIAASPIEDSPQVIAYRMGQLENAVREGFAAHDKKLGELTNGFATKEELATVQRQLDNWRWYFRALVSAVLIALATGVAGLVIKR